MPVELVAVGPPDWAQWRALRLEALRDTPIGFVRTHAESAQLGEQDWCAWLSRPGGFWLLSGAGAPVAMAAAWEEGGRAWLGAVYVQPHARGSGLLDRLVEAAVDWARARGHAQLSLEVHEDNARARAAYRRLGFVENGGRRPYPLDPSRDELELVRVC